MNPLKKISSVAVAIMLCVFTAGTGADAEELSSGAPATSFTFARDLTLGTKGDDVSALQQFLINGGFLKIPAPTGYFGPLTKTTLAAWQAKAGISPSSGFFGRISRGKLNTAVKPVLDGATTETVALMKAVSVNSGSGLPVRLKISNINVDAGFQYNGLSADGTMEIPDNIVDVGWFKGSARPGEKGVAVVTGHVAQIRGGIMTKPGVFTDLNKLRAGDKLSVLNDKGETVTFVVRDIRNYDPAADATDVFVSKDGGIHLNLITCEGAWNPAKLSYSQRLVVFTDAVK